jgi:hypothetical protein
MQQGDVRFGSKTDILPANSDVRFTPESGSCAITHAPNFFLAARRRLDVSRLSSS